MDWDKLRVFHAAADAGSFTHAAEKLNMSQSAISRQVSALERDLNVPLFHRHARGLILTEQGELLFRTAQDVMARLSSTKIRLTDSRGKPSGDLRITTTSAFGALWLTPRLDEFMDLYPDIRIQLILDDHEIDIGTGQADIALRFQPPSQSDLVRRKLFVVHNHSYASVDYVNKHGAPRSLQELDSHRILIYGDAAPPHLRRLNWLETAGRDNGEPRRAALQINSVLGLREAVREGVGIAFLPDYVAREDPRLVAVLSNEKDVPEFEVYFAYPEEMRSAKRIDVFRDFLIAKAREWSY